MPLPVLEDCGLLSIGCAGTSLGSQRCSRNVDNSLVLNAWLSLAL